MKLTATVGEEIREFDVLRHESIGRQVLVGEFFLVRTRYSNVIPFPGMAEPDPVVYGIFATCPIALDIVGSKKMLRDLEWAIAVAEALYEWQKVRTGEEE